MDNRLLLYDGIDVFSDSIVDLVTSDSAESMNGALPEYDGQVDDSQLNLFVEDSIDSVNEIVQVSKCHHPQDDDDLTLVVEDLVDELVSAVANDVNGTTAPPSSEFEPAEQTTVSTPTRKRRRRSRNVYGKPARRPKRPPSSANNDASRMLPQKEKKMRMRRYVAPREERIPREITRLVGDLVTEVASRLDPHDKAFRNSSTRRSLLLKSAPRRPSVAHVSLEVRRVVRSLINRVVKQVEDDAEPDITTMCFVCDEFLTMKQKMLLSRVDAHVFHHIWRSSVTTAVRDSASKQRVRKEVIYHAVLKLCFPEIDLNDLQSHFAPKPSPQPAIKSLRFTGLRSAEKLEHRVIYDMLNTSRDDDAAVIDNKTNKAASDEDEPPPVTVAAIEVVSDEIKQRRRRRRPIPAVVYSPPPEKEPKRPVSVVTKRQSRPPVVKTQPNKLHRPKRPAAPVKRQLVKRPAVVSTPVSRIRLGRVDSRDPKAYELHGWQTVVRLRRCDHRIPRRAVTITDSPKRRRDQRGGGDGGASGRGRGGPKTVGGGASKPATRSSRSGGGGGGGSSGGGGGVRRLSMGRCQLCKEAVGFSATAHIEHVVYVHFDTDLFCCSLCKYSSRNDPSAVDAHIEKSHKNNNAAFMKDVRGQHWQRLNDWHVQCFDEPLARKPPALTPKLPADEIVEVVIDDGESDSFTQSVSTQAAQRSTRMVKKRIAPSVVANAYPKALPERSAKAAAKDFIAVQFIDEIVSDIHTTRKVEKSETSSGKTTTRRGRKRVAFADGVGQPPQKKRRGSNQGLTNWTRSESEIDPLLSGVCAECNQVVGDTAMQKHCQSHLSARRQYRYACAAVNCAYMSPTPRAIFEHGEQVHGAKAGFVDCLMTKHVYRNAFTATLNTCFPHSAVCLLCSNQPIDTTVAEMMAQSGTKPVPSFRDHVYWHLNRDQNIQRYRCPPCKDKPNSGFVTLYSLRDHCRRIHATELPMAFEQDVVIVPSFVVDDAPKLQKQFDATAQSCFGAAMPRLLVAMRTPAPVFKPKRPVSKAERPKTEAVLKRKMVQPPTPVESMRCRICAMSVTLEGVDAHVGWHYESKRAFWKRYRCLKCSVQSDTIAELGDCLRNHGSSSVIDVTGSEGKAFIAQFKQNLKKDTFPDYESVKLSNMAMRRAALNQDLVICNVCPPRKRTGLLKSKMAQHIYYHLACKGYPRFMCEVERCRAHGCDRDIVISKCLSNHPEEVVIEDKTEELQGRFVMIGVQCFPSASKEDVGIVQLLDDLLLRVSAEDYGETYVEETMDVTTTSTSRPIPAPSTPRKRATPKKPAAAKPPKKAPQPKPPKTQSPAKAQPPPPFLTPAVATTPSAQPLAATVPSSSLVPPDPLPSTADQYHPAALSVEPNFHARQQPQYQPPAPQPYYQPPPPAVYTSCHMNTPPPPPPPPPRIEEVERSLADQPILCFKCNIRIRYGDRQQHIWALHMGGRRPTANDGWLVQQQPTQQQRMEQLLGDCFGQIRMVNDGGGSATPPAEIRLHDDSSYPGRYTAPHTSASYPSRQYENMGGGDYYRRM